MTLLRGLPAAATPQSRMLVLGSMPGEASLSAGRYYAHPRNRFWPLMAQLGGFDAGLDYPQRMRALNAAGIGVWDVIGQCRRRGSLDTAIERGSEVANPLGELITRLPQLQAIAFNGGKAAQAFARHVQPQLPASALDGIALLAMPSTSPANASFPLARLIERWGALAAYL